MQSQLPELINENKEKKADFMKLIEGINYFTLDDNDEDGYGPLPAIMLMSRRLLAGRKELAGKWGDLCVCH